MIGDDLYIVVAKATTPDGRTDQATGAVSIGNLRGEQKANAIMKAENQGQKKSYPEHFPGLWGGRMNRKLTLFLMQN